MYTPGDKVVLDGNTEAVYVQELFSQYLFRASDARLITISRGEERVRVAKVPKATPKVAEQTES